MASSKEYLIFILEQLSGLDDITYRAMMGEYILYYRERVIGGIYDDRFLVKPVRAAVNLMPNAEMEVPYEGAKGMLAARRVEMLHAQPLRDLTAQGGHHIAEGEAEAVFQPSGIATETGHGLDMQAAHAGAQLQRQTQQGPPTSSSTS